MGKKATKATKKYVASGQLKKKIQARHKHQQIQKKIHGRKGGKDSKAKGKSAQVGDEDENGEDEKEEGANSKKQMTVDDLLNGEFMDASGSEDDDDAVERGSDDESDGNLDAIDDDASFASIDELDEDGGMHLQELSKLAEKDPEFYKYLQENDKELLDFDPNSMIVDESYDEEEDETKDADSEGKKRPNLTKEHLRKWQKALLEQHSLRALRKLLVAFRSAAHLNEDDQVLAWSIDNASVYNKLVTTAFRYTPIVLDHHIPYKTLASGKIKPPAQTHKFETLQKLILSYFHNIVHILSQLTDPEMLRLAVSESSKLVPYVISSRRTVKAYLNKCLEIWSRSDDSTRITAFLALRKLAHSSDASLMNTILKSTYLHLIRSSRSTNTHTLPSINLMKNSASEVFCVDHRVAYQHAFGYIRQLAIHLRNSMKVKTKEAYKQVYNWQFIHCIDFWCIVLARACDVQAEAEGGKESDLRLLIYPLVQVSLGSIKLIPNSRSYPFHLHIVRSILHLANHTLTYIPLSPYLVPIISASLSPSSRHKPSTLRPLDLEVQIRVPLQYMKTRVYFEGITEEAVFLLAEWLSSPAVHGSIAFPEIVIPVVVMLRKAVKAAEQGTSKEQALVKALLERVDESARWIQEKRKDVSFAPGKLGEVAKWEEGLRKLLGDAPLLKYLKVQRKAREKKRKLVEKAREGQDEILEEE